MTNSKSWVGFDLDGTLAEYLHWDDGKIGKPIWATVNLVKTYLEKGVRVKIMTARVCNMRVGQEAGREREKIERWCEAYIGQKLEITHEKDWAMLLLYDDRCIAVEPNTGVLLSTHPFHERIHGGPNAG